MTATTTTSYDQRLQSSSATSGHQAPGHLMWSPASPAVKRDQEANLALEDSPAESETARDSSSTNPVRAIARSLAARSPSRQEHVRTLQLWEGTVLRVGEDEFHSTLRDLTDDTQPEENGTFALEEVLEDDRSLVRPGAVFYWHVSYNTEHGTRRLVSQLRFRRLPSWTNADVERVSRRAAEQYDALFQADDD